MRFVLSLAVLPLLFAVGCATAPKVEERAPASSEQLGRPVRLNQCGGHIELREAGNGDLSIKIENLNSQQCPTFTVYDNSSRRVIKRYDLESSFNLKASYTLSKKMIGELGHDCQINFTISGSWKSDGFIVYIPWCVPQHNQPVRRNNSDLHYEVSNSGNCKLMKNNQYTNENVSDAYCKNASKGDRITFEWSNSGNCKRMKNGEYDNENVSDSFCTNRHGQ